LIVSIIELALGVGCSHQPSEEEHAITIAKQEYVKRGGTGENEFHARKEGNKWTVTIWSLPKTPGGFVMVELTNEWKVIGYYVGD
jgi:hypothetical protein